jgi:hypothetical protein
MARFRWYLEQLLAPGEGGDLDISLPIGSVNPMGREHCLKAVEALIAMNAESAVASAVGQAAQRLAAIPGRARLCINLLDDLRGGWTNRYLDEAGLRFGSEHGLRANRSRHFVVVPVWTSESYTPEILRAEALAAIYRHAAWSVAGLPKTLDAMLRQEGLALRFAGGPPSPALLAPSLPPDELAHTREVLAPWLEDTGFPVHFSAFFGDEPALACGYPGLGLSPRAGFALALHGAGDLDPVSALQGLAV